MRALKRDNTVTESKRDKSTFVRDSRNSIDSLVDFVEKMDRAFNDVEEDPNNYHKVDRARYLCKQIIKTATALENMLSDENLDKIVMSESVELNNNDRAWAKEIFQVARDLRHTDNLIESLMKKVNRGASLDREVLRSSSTLAIIIREAIEQYKKDYLTSAFNVRSEISKAARDLIKDYMVDYILEQVEE